MAIFGLGAMGCTPGELAKFGASPGSACVDEINDAVQLFNDRLKLLVDDLNAKFSDARFTYINIFTIGSVDATTLGMYYSLIKKKKEKEHSIRGREYGKRNKIYKNLK